MIEIKTGIRIYTELDSAFILMQDDKIGELSKKRWVSVESLKEAIAKEREAYPLVTSSDWIENSTAKKVFDWLIELIEEQQP